MQLNVRISEGLIELIDVALNVEAVNELLVRELPTNGGVSRAGGGAGRAMHWWHCEMSVEDGGTAAHLSQLAPRFGIFCINWTNKVEQLPVYPHVLA